MRTIEDYAAEVAMWNAKTEAMYAKYLQAGDRWREAENARSNAIDDLLKARNGFVVEERL